MIEVTRERLLEHVPQTDAEISELLMRAFIYRRAWSFAAQGIGDVVPCSGSMHSAATLRVKEFLTRNGHPFSYLDLDRRRRAGGAWHCTSPSATFRC